MITGYARNFVNYFKKNFLVQFTYIDCFIHIVVCNENFCLLVCHIVLDVVWAELYTFYVYKTGWF